MKVCPTCNNMSNDNVSICPYCGRNIIGIKENYFDLKNKEKLKEEYKMEPSEENANLSEKIYGPSRTRGKGYKIVNVKKRTSTKYSYSLKKNIALFVVLVFLASLVNNINGYKLVLSNQSKLIIFLIPTIYSVTLFLGISLRAGVKVKIFVAILLSLAFLTTYGYFSNFTRYGILEFVLKIENLSVISITLLASIIQYRYIKVSIFTLLLVFISYKYYLHLKTFGFETIDMIPVIKSLSLFVLALCFTLFLIYELIFISSEKEDVFEEDF